MLAPSGPWSTSRTRTRQRRCLRARGRVSGYRLRTILYPSDAHAGAYGSPAGGVRLLRDVRARSVVSGCIAYRDAIAACAKRAARGGRWRRLAAVAALHARREGAARSDRARGAAACRSRVSDHFNSALAEGRRSGITPVPLAPTPDVCVHVRGAEATPLGDRVAWRLGLLSSAREVDTRSLLKLVTRCSGLETPARESSSAAYRVLEPTDDGRCVFRRTPGRASSVAARLGSSRYRHAWVKCTSVAMSRAVVTGTHSERGDFDGP